MLSADQVTQGFVQSYLEKFQHWRFSSLSVQPVPMLASPHCEKTFPCVKLEPSMFYSLGF